jgi:MFS transporter, SP family, arabinose:H+ symporter
MIRIFTLFAMSIIDRFGRKKLLVIGAAGMTVCLAGVATIYFLGTHQGLLVWLLVGFIACFAFSQGAVIWVYISEVFPNRVRAKGQSLGTLTHWVFNAAISFGFPEVASHSRGAPFAFFSAMMLLMFFVVLARYPETKGITLEDMQRKLGIA